MTLEQLVLDLVLLVGISGWVLWGHGVATAAAAARNARRHPPRIRIAVPHAEAIFTRAWLDGVELRYVKRVRFDTGHDIGDGQVVVTIDIVADVEMVGDTGLVISGETFHGTTYEVKR